MNCIRVVAWKDHKECGCMKAAEKIRTWLVKSIQTQKDGDKTAAFHKFDDICGTVLGHVRGTLFGNEALLG